jgi:CIC family chloride channel protein
MKPNQASRELLFLLYCMLTGALAGAVALGFLAFIALGQWAFWPAGGNLLNQVSQSPWWLKLLVPTLGGLALGPVIGLWVPEMRGPGVAELIEAEVCQEGRLESNITVFKTMLTALFISTGGSLGREGPVANMGAAIASVFSRFSKLSPEKTKVCLACGAAGGIAATFNAPLGGALFAVEIILLELRLVYLGHIVLASLAGVLVCRHIWQGYAIFHLPAFHFAHTTELGLYLILGLLAGLLALLFTRAVFASDTLFRKLPVPEWLKPAIGGLLLGLVGLYSPHVFGVGYESIDLALAGKIALAGAFTMMAAKFLATSVCLGSMSGGIMGPSLFMGAMLGTGLGLAANLIFPQMGLQPANYAMVGMAAVLSGTTLGPVTAMVIIFELSNSQEILAPLIVSCITSMAVVRVFYGYSIYQTKLLRRGIDLSKAQLTCPAPEVEKT